MFSRFFFPRAVVEPSTVFKLGYPSDFSLGVPELFEQLARIWVVREADRIFVNFARCTHFGCTPDSRPSGNKFKFPCYGSGYAPEGINFEGSAPRLMAPLARPHQKSESNFGRKASTYARENFPDSMHGCRTHPRWVRAE